MININQLIGQLLRIITPEEINEITTKHNGGQFIPLTDFAHERLLKNYSRNFAEQVDVELFTQEAKILPFVKDRHLTVEGKEIATENMNSLAGQAAVDLERPMVGHNEGENTSSFILIEKERLKRSQQVLKQREILDLYKKNSTVEIQHSNTEDTLADKKELTGVLVNRKHY